MKRLFLLISSICLLVHFSAAQQITGMEYYFDSDPGIGNGTFVDITDTDELELEYNFPLDGLAFGLHDLFIRLLDTDGNWSLTNRKQFLFFEGNTAFEIDGLEYFLDEDPGVGQATFVDLPNSPVINQAVDLDLSNFEPGFHLLYIRVKDTNGSYSLAMAKPILIADGDNNNNTLSRVEYFLNEDPGYGNGKQIVLNNASTVNDAFDLDLSDAETGIHQLFIRVQDNFGAWSHTQQSQVVIFDGGGMDLELSKVEYYFDEDPGFGNGFQVEVDGSIVDSQLVFLIPENLSLGEHTMYVRAIDKQGRWSHYNTKEIFACPGGPAIAGFRPIRFGNKLAFVDTAKNVLDHLYDFGDGTTSTLANPTHIFGFGAFTVTQVVENGCNSDTATYDIEIKGIERHTPTRAGLGGDVVVTIYGGGFDENTAVQLSKGGTTVDPIATAAVSYTEYNAVFDFHTITNGGFYDMTVDIDGVEVINIPNAIFMEDARYPRCVSTIEGPELWRRNRNTTFNLVIENTGNINAKGVPTFIVVPADVEIEILSDNEWFFWDTTETFIYFDDETQNTYDVEWEEVKYIVEGLRFDYLEIDTFNGVPFNGRVYDLLIPNIPGNTSISIPFRALSSSTGDIDLKTFTAHLNMYGSPSTPQYLDMSDNMISMGIDAAWNVADESNNKLAQAFFGSVKVGREHLRLAGSYFGMRSAGISHGETFGKVYGGGNLDKANAYALKTAGEIVVDKGLGQMSQIDAAAVTKLKGRIKHMNGRILKTSDVGMRQLRQRINDRFLEQLKDQVTETGRREFLWNAYKKINDYNDAADYLGTTLEFLENCPELANLKDEIIQEIDKVLGQEDEKTKKTRVINSTDPNAIYGPQGYNADYILKGRNAHYIVAFENVDTASAAAQIVEITNMLDANIYDFSTFELSHVMIAGELIRFPSERQEFVTEYDLRPEKNLIVQINAEFNTETGEIYWKFLSLDPITGDITEDPLLGFLDPNVTSPEGEGWVSYNVKLKDDLFHNTAWDNVASIIFDDNDAIITNIHENTIDDVVPESQILGDYTMVNDTTILLNVEGSDDGSGIKFYEIYASNDDETYFPYTSTFGDPVPVYSSEDSVLYLYSIGVDSLGNKEVKNSADVMVMFNPVAVVQQLLDHESIDVYPNPSNGQFKIDIDLDQAQAISIEMVDVHGRVVAERSMNYTGQLQQYTMDVIDVSNGVYLLQIKNERGALLMSDKMIIQ